MTTCQGAVMADQLPVDMPKQKRASPGPVYQGVCAQIRKLQALAVIDDPGKGEDGRHDGLIAQARSLAGSIDRASGHSDPRHQASGVSLAALHERLADILARLDPDEATGGPDKFDELLDDLRTMPPLQTPPRSTNG